MIVGAALVTYWVAVRAANDAYDRSLLDPVLDIADHIRNDGSGAHVDLPQKALEALVYDQLDTVIFQVRSDRNEIIDGVSELPPPPAIAPREHAAAAACRRRCASAPTAPRRPPDACRAVAAPRAASGRVVRAPPNAPRDGPRWPTREPAARAGQGRERARSRPAAGSHRPDG